MPTARCESCKSSFETEGAAAVCPLCGQPAEVDLTIRVLCSCGTVLKAPPKLRGRVIICPRCTRPVPIPRGDEAEEQRGAAQVGRLTRWVFALFLIPIFIAMQGDPDDPRKRVERSLTAANRGDVEAGGSLADRIAAIPGGRADRAVLPRSSPMPFVYGAAGFALVYAFLWLSFGTPKLARRELAGGAALMAAAGAGLGFLVHLILPIPAGPDSMGRVLATAVLAGAGAELIKTAWIGWRGGNLRRRPILLLGLAVGAGFGAGQAVATGILVFGGVALPRAYWMEFISLIALQSIWSGTAALFLARSRERAGPLMNRIFAAPGASMALHVIFEVLHRRDLFNGSLVVGLASFLLFHALHFWTEETVEETIAGETIRV
jgi:hypothetical protein